jgi:hypothetical protein
MGAGMTVLEQESWGSSATPAAAAADSRMNWRRESMVLFFGAVMTVWI